MLNSFAVALPPIGADGGDGGPKAQALLQIASNKGIHQFAGALREQWELACHQLAMKTPLVKKIDKAVQEVKDKSQEKIFWNGPLRRSIQTMVALKCYDDLLGHALWKKFADSPISMVRSCPPGHFASVV